MRKPQFDSIELVVADIRRGRMVIVVDDEDRENEGDLVMAGAMVTPDHVNFMRKHAGGLICVTLTPERADELERLLLAGRAAGRRPRTRSSPASWRRAGGTA